jgi:hypothetical protein
MTEHHSFLISLLPLVLVGSRVYRPADNPQMTRKVLLW